MVGQSPVQADRLIEAVRFYRRIGFFEQFGALRDDELSETLNDAYRTKSLGHRDLRQVGELLDLALLGLDQGRVWSRDLEDDVFPGEDAYVRILSEWAAISRGAFLPDSSLSGGSGRKVRSRCRSA
jgi:hypothetical protein